MKSTRHPDSTPSFNTPAPWHLFLGTHRSGLLGFVAAFVLIVSTGSADAAYFFSKAGPANGGGAGAPALLKWNPTAPNQYGPQYYKVCMSTSATACASSNRANFTGQITGTSTTRTVSTSTKYYWSVAVVKCLNSACTSSTWSFADGGTIWSFNSPATGSTTLAKTCLIFVHGLQQDSGTYVNWSIARNYWKGNDATTGVATDFIKTATRNFAISYYVTNWNADQSWWNNTAAELVGAQIVNATNGGLDNGGNRCSTTYANGGRFIVVAHSGGGVVMDYILGNNDASDPNYPGLSPTVQSNFATAAARISHVFTTSGAHRGSQGADRSCANDFGVCNVLAEWIRECDSAVWSYRTADDVNVKTYSSPPAKNVWLIGGYQAVPGASACLNGDDDGVVQFASMYACNGSATANYGVTNVCNNSNKQETSGFRNVDAAWEIHANIGILKGAINTAGESNAERKAVPDGIWACNGGAPSVGGGTPCTPGTFLMRASSGQDIANSY